MRDAKGNWVPDLSLKGYDVFNDYHRFLALWGSRKAGKTISGSVNKIARHLWDNDRAVVAIVGKTLRNLKSAGVWQDLTVHPWGLNQWFHAHIGFKYSVEPKITGDTKVTYFRVMNRHGTESECQVHSLDHEPDVEAKFKGARFSMVYMPEADQFEDRETFNILSDQLRSETVPYEEQQLIADFNPPDCGRAHFLHDLWFKQVYKDGNPFPDRYKALFRNIRFTLDDNPFLTAEDRAELEDKYRYDQRLYTRFVLGDWPDDAAGGLFNGLFFENTHVIGNVKSPNQDDWEIIVPGPSAVSVAVGWDPGDLNHSVSFLCPRPLLSSVAFDLIDEVVSIEKELSLEDFTDLVLERMDFWIDQVKARYGHTITFRHWGDPSLQRWRSTVGGTDEMIIRQVSNGRIPRIIPADRAPHSVVKRVGVLKRFLFDNRIQVSALCKQHIAMFKNIPEHFSKTDPYKHALDSLTFALASEAPMDVDRRLQPTVDRRMVTVDA